VPGELIHQDDGGRTRGRLHATREGDGALLLAGQVVGPSLREIAGDSDCEYWIRIPPPFARDITIAELREVAHRPPGGSPAVMEWLRARGVPFGFHSHM